MFKSISWQEFINAAAIVLGGYYVISVILLYYKEIIQKLRGKTSSDDKSLSHAPTNPPHDLMGKAKQDLPKKHQQIVEANEIEVAEGGNRMAINESEDSLLIGTVSDLLHEVKVLARVIRESQGTKGDGAPMFQSLLSNYPQLFGTKFQETISLFIYEQCKGECAFDIEINEVTNWWSSTETQNNQ